MICPVLTAVSRPLSTASILAVAESPQAQGLLPDFVRPGCLWLNGPKQFEFDDNDMELREQWQNGSRQIRQRTVVPYPIESRSSGMGETSW